MKAVHQKLMTGESKSEENLLNHTQNVATIIDPTFNKKSETFTSHQNNTPLPMTKGKHLFKRVHRKLLFLKFKILCRYRKTG